MIRTNSIQLDGAVAKQLLSELLTGKYKDAYRLPPELDIAKDMGVSRTALRDGISILEREGFVTRKWGLGTLINHHVLGVKTRIDIEEEFLETIRRAGYTASLGDTIAEKCIADQRDADKLRIEINSPVIRIHRIAYADKIPAIYCTDTFSADLIKNNDFPDSELNKPIFGFLTKYCETDVFIDLTEIHAVNADTSIAGKLKIKEGTAVLFLDEVGYDYQGNPILHSDEYYHEGIITYTTLRNKIG